MNNHQEQDGAGADNTAPEGLAAHLARELREQSRYPSGAPRISAETAREIVAAALSTAPATPEAGDTRRGDGGLIEADRVLALYNGGLVHEPSDENPRGYVTYYRPREAMQKALAALTAKPVDAPVDVVERVAQEARWLFGAFACGAGFKGAAYRDAVSAFNISLDESVAAALRTQSAVSDCPSCGGLNTSCPDGCGRDENGELDGSTLAGDAGDHAGLVERLRAKADYTDRVFDNSSLGEQYRAAAQAITAQAAENARLRERVKALEEVVREARIGIAFTSGLSVGAEGGDWSAFTSNDAVELIAKIDSLLGTGEDGKPVSEGDG